MMYWDAEVHTWRISVHCGLLNPSLRSCCVSLSWFVLVLTAQIYGCTLLFLLYVSVHALSGGTSSCGMSSGSVVWMFAIWVNWYLDLSLTFYLLYHYKPFSNQHVMIIKHKNTNPTSGYPRCLHVKHVLLLIEPMTLFDLEKTRWPPCTQEVASVEAFWDTNMASVVAARCQSGYSQSHIITHKKVDKLMACYACFCIHLSRNWKADSTIPTFNKDMQDIKHRPLLTSS